MRIEQLLATIEDRCRELGLSESEFSQAVAGHRTVLTDIRRGRSPSAERLRKISEVLGLEFYIGPPRGALGYSVLANIAKKTLKADWPDRQMVAMEKAMEMADAAEDSNDFLIGALKAGVLSGVSPQSLRHVVPDDDTVAEMAHAMRESGWSDREIAAMAKAMELSSASVGTESFLVETFKHVLLAEVSPQPLLHAVEDSAQALNRAIIEAGGDPVPADLWPVLDGRRESSVPMPNSETHSPASRPVEVVELAAAGGGADDASEEVIGSVWFRQDWFEGQGLDPSRCVVVRAKGKSMEPVLCEGAPILVDRDRRRRVENRIFVVRTMDGLVAKRAGRDSGGKWQLVSEHPSWAPMPWQKDTETIGQAVWTARSLI